tara:strand:- start:289 stop:462 length:174 start_codon:yes stop_codon:yes gene_type:complete
VWWKDGVKETMNKYNDELLEAVQEIAEIIYMELDIEYQDVWLKRVMDKGIWSPDDGC